MKKLLFIAILFLSGCDALFTDKGDAYRALKQDGFTNIHFTGYDFFSCGKDNWYHTGFIAKKNGYTIKGVVCSGLIFKNTTIRYE